ncbi:tricarboxylate carrier [Oesophagostomum dentatum]|uniref:Tricarboxylate carrier n=1 Tax=Oesophagostomum dentatum TaxID=61180 RepID=A0A0B1TPM0_OESDE|nr:tricarboxylate carrier [Oesophagostomum dentatum]
MGSEYIRGQHFFAITNPLNLFNTDKQLRRYQRIVEDYKKGEVSDTLTVEQLWKAKHVYDSAFHPTTGEKMFIVGRMSAQVPGNMFLTGGMLTFYKSPAAVIFWQWLNQSFNAVVNYTNRSGESSDTKTLIQSYCAATGGALFAALGLNSLVKLIQSYCAATGGALFAALGLNSLVKSAPPLIGRLVPFVAVCVANAINIPMMRRGELTEGIDIVDADGNKVGSSKRIARSAIAQVIISRIGMATPTFALIPVIVNALEKRPYFKVRPYLFGPLQTILCGLILTISTPVGCAFFPQMTPIKVSKLEPELQEKIRALPSSPTIVYCNKGL